MKTRINGEKITIKQVDIEMSKLLLKGEIEEAGLELSIELAQEKNAIVDNIFEQVMFECDKFQQINRIHDGKDLLTKHRLASIVTNIMYTAIDNLHKEGRNAFVCYIEEAKDKLRAFMNKKYNIEDKKVYYTITNKDLLDFIKERNGVKEGLPETNDKDMINTKIDKILELLDRPQYIQEAVHTGVEEVIVKEEQPKKNTNKPSKNEKRTYDLPGGINIIAHAV
ncbi:MAG TPA: hypothetical protein PLW93_02290 [Candidatus Absconditabacterales bacterium]|nr:hypothetical protein [Candidatus Absconditabacterales bacterium]